MMGFLTFSRSQRVTHRHHHYKERIQTARMGNAESAPSAGTPGNEEPTVENANSAIGSPVTGEEEEPSWSPEVSDVRRGEHCPPNDENPLPEDTPLGSPSPESVLPGTQEEDSPQPTETAGADCDGDRDDDSHVSALIEEDAAVFHYLSVTNADSENSSLDDISLSDMSAAVFDLLDSNDNRAPLRKFLETTTTHVVSEVIHEDEVVQGDKVSPLPRREQFQPPVQDTRDRYCFDGNYSVGRQRAAISQALNRRHGEIQDSDPPLRRPPSRLQLHKGDDEQSVLSEMSQSIFRVLDGKDSNIAKYRVAQNSPSIFDVLEKEVELDERDDRSVESLDESTPEDAFNIVEGRDPEADGEREITISDIPASGDESLVNQINPHADLTKLMKRNIFHILTKMQDKESETVEVDRVSNGLKDVVDRTTQGAVRIPMGETRQQTDNVPSPSRKGVPLVNDSNNQDSSREQPESSENKVIRTDTSNQEIQEDVDPLFVQRFDEVFNQFIGLHPKFLLSNPELVRHIRINKLQNLLEHMDEYEKRLETQTSHVLEEKQLMENHLSNELREASRNKAAYEVQLQADLAAVNQKTSFKQAQITWKILSAWEAKAKKEYVLEQNMKQKRESFFKDNLSGIPTRTELLDLLPGDAEGKILKAAISFVPHDNEELNHAEEMRKYQFENALLASEIVALKSQLSGMEGQSERFAWVDPLLRRLNKTQMANLKKKFTRKLGVVSLD